jgi:hypothetical protein
MTILKIYPGMRLQRVHGIHRRRGRASTKHQVVQLGRIAGHPSFEVVCTVVDGAGLGSSFLVCEKELRDITRWTLPSRSAHDSVISRATQEMLTELRDQLTRNERYVHALEGSLRRVYEIMDEVTPHQALVWRQTKEQAEHDRDPHRGGCNPHCEACALSEMYRLLERLSSMIRQERSGP